MRAIIHDAFRASWPLAVSVAVYVAIVVTLQHGWSVDAIGVIAGITAVTAVLFGAVVTIYLATAKKSRVVAGALYVLTLSIIALWLSESLDAELGFGDIVAMVLVSLVAYGAAASWTLMSPRLVRLVPASLLTLAALFVLYAKRE